MRKLEVTHANSNFACVKLEVVFVIWQERSIYYYIIYRRTAFLIGITLILIGTF